MPEVQDVINEYVRINGNVEVFNTPQFKAFNSILNCRTSAMGAHMNQCNNCDNLEISYNSCRNRHCPKCQTLKKEQWINKQQQYLLNEQYFHVVFTIPDNLNGIIIQNQQKMYNVFFKAVSQTLIELAADQKYLGAKIGITTVLHTWGQNLMYHPHIHCIIPAGGLDHRGKWRKSKKKFFMPVRVLSKLFRGKFLSLMKEEELIFTGKIKKLEQPVNIDSLMTHLYQKDWVVYCKKPFKSATHVINYLGRYTHRVAITNNRILKIQDGMVTFKMRDYKDSNKLKHLTITINEFVRRFLLHILPSRFHKIRHYGLLASRDKSARITACKKLTATPIIPFAPKEAFDILKEILGHDFNKCPKCDVGKLGLHSPP